MVGADEALLLLDRHAELGPDSSQTGRRLAIPLRRKWSMRCDGSTLEVFPVPAAGATFELDADFKLPTRHSRRARAGTRTVGTVFDPDANAERPQWAQWGGRRA